QCFSPPTTESVRMKVSFPTIRRKLGPELPPIWLKRFASASHSPTMSLAGHSPSQRPKPRCSPDTSIMAAALSRTDLSLPQCRIENGRERRHAHPPPRLVSKIGSLIPGHLILTSGTTNAFQEYCSALDASREHTICGPHFRASTIRASKPLIYASLSAIGFG